MKWPWLEFICAAVFGGIALRFGFAWALPAFLVFAFSSIALCIIDYRHHLLPNRIIYPTLIASLILLTLAAAITGDWNFLLRAVMGMFAAWMFFFVVWLIKPQAMGFGDVRLALLVGLFTGWMSLANVFLGVFLGLLLGAVAGLAFVALKKVGVRDPIPYGPFLIAGAFLSILFGESIAPVITG